MCPGRLLGEASQLLGDAVGELVPPEAQVHLANAQRELLLAVTATLEHHLRQQRARRAAEGEEREANRPRHIDIE